jgi:hypothetical protein
MTFEKETSYFGKECLFHDLKWYENYFRPEPGREEADIRGDVSPWYARLSKQSVQAAHRVLPHAQLILIIRNPIERAWSHALMEFSRDPRRDLSCISDWRWMAHFDRLRQRWYGDYARTIENWTAYYSPQQLHVDLYERVSEDPDAMMRDVLNHIGADPNWMPPADSLHSRHWTIGEVTGGRSGGVELPDSLRWHLAKQWLEPTQRLNERLNGRVDHWVTQMKQITARPVPLSWRAMRTAHRAVVRWPKRIAFVAYDTAREHRLSRAYQRITPSARISSSPMALTT